MTAPETDQVVPREGVRATVARHPVLIGALGLFLTSGALWGFDWVSRLVRDTRVSSEQLRVAVALVILVLTIGILAWARSLVVDGVGPWILNHVGTVLTTGLILTGSIALVGIWWAPQWAHFDATTVAERNAIRDAFVRLAIGVGAATAGILAWGRLDLSRREHQLASLEHDLSKEAQYTDRYTRAIEQLGSDHVDIQLGGIYALERLSRDSDRDQGTIAAVLQSYLRRVSLLGPPSGAIPTIGAALTVLARNPWPQVIDLRGLPLPGVDLTSVDLSGLWLAGANLAGAQLADANLSRADLSGADLTGASLARACLAESDLDRANLARADLENADLTSAQLCGTNFTEACLRSAGMSQVYAIGMIGEGATFSGAFLVGANLACSRLARSNFIVARLDGANLSECDCIAAQFGAADMSGADLNSANLTDASLSACNLTNASFAGTNLTNVAFDQAYTISEDCSQIPFEVPPLG